MDIAMMTPGMLVEYVADKMEPRLPFYHGGRPRGLGANTWNLTGVGLIENAQLPYLIWQYEGSSLVTSFQATVETERAIAYNIWHKGVHEADAKEFEFLNALMKTKRVVGVNESYSFTDSATSRPPLIHGIHREVLIRGRGWHSQS